MAKNGVSEGDSDMAAKATELKRELQKLVKAIVDADDVDLEATDRALQMLRDLKELKLKKSMSLKLRSGYNNQETVSGMTPEEFICPLSKELMRDPVIVANGQVMILVSVFFMLIFVYAILFSWILDVCSLDLS